MKQTPEEIEERKDIEWENPNMGFPIGEYERKSILILFFRFSAFVFITGLIFFLWEQWNFLISLL